MKFNLAFIIVVISQLTFAKTKEPAYAPNIPKPTHSEVRYGTHERNVLDFWRAESKSPTPLAFVIHGGAWKGGSKGSILTSEGKTRKKVNHSQIKPWIGRLLPIL